jgi:CRP-like cAMP-binding protein
MVLHGALRSAVVARALLSEERRAASCVATSDNTVILSLTRADFDRMLGR